MGAKKSPLVNAMSFTSHDLYFQKPIQALLNHFLTCYYGKDGLVKGIVNNCNVLWH